MTEHRTDLVVVGCGAGGLSTAVQFLQSAPGAEVVVLERTPRARRGGNTAWTGAFFRLEPDGTPAPDFEQRMLDLSEGRTDPAIVSRLAAEAEPTMRWLEAQGVKTIADTTYFLTSKGPRLMPAGGGAAIVEQLCTRVEELGGTIVYETTATRLLQDDEGRVVGLAATDAGGDEVVWHAPTVVLACGGFEGSPDLLAEHLGEHGSALPTITPGGRANQGEGLIMGIAAGADVDGQFDRFHGEPVDPRAHCAEALVMVYPYGILVDHGGNRFVDEGSDTPDNTFEHVAYRIWRDADQFAYLIADQKLARQEIGRAVLTDRAPESADTLVELAGRLDIDPSSLEATVATYNAAAVPGPLDLTRLDGVRTTGLTPPKSNWARPIDEPPFVAWPVTCAITFTFGGLRTDADARVLTAAGASVPGLYAVGEIAGIYHGKYPGATSVLRALAFGRIAGRTAAGRVRQPSAG
ncbi:FAD-binding protein [Pseudonocardia kunmingensis]|uniref:Tricarballylate dehydrogenase n=1 Tax=Pseudonocardia kunmingensis TaxID=630975 RepID=A0A543DPN2_9PSEU|nr:FAD-binding protein [Pseudonocardia kunmingensis]TQM11291.1 tricarballylate dehydrogenase [Pseudonocardia kunmingensis]